MRSTLLPITFLVNLIFSIVELLLSVRILLRLFGANPQTPFVNWVYQTTSPLLAPFTGIFPNPVINGGFVLEIPSLFALLIYGFIAYLIANLIDFVNDRLTVDSTTTIVKKR